MPIRQHGTPSPPPETAPARRAPWRHPAIAPLSSALNLIANSPLLRTIGRRLPSAAMASDITDVVYINYILEADRLEPLVLPPLTLQRLGPDGRYAVFSILTFRHGHFGPECFGRLRVLWPSPIQSNWRIHVLNPATGTRGVQFLTTAITSTPHALATRLLADGVPMHVPKSASHCRNADGSISLTINPGHGSAPDLQARFTPTPPTRPTPTTPTIPNPHPTPAAEPLLEGPWAACFPTYRDLLAYIVPQDRAMTAINGRVIRQEINLGIPLDSCLPLRGEITSNTATHIAGPATPICFLVDKVRFRFAEQQWDEPPFMPGVEPSSEWLDPSRH